MLICRRILLKRFVTLFGKRCKVEFQQVEAQEKIQKIKSMALEKSRQNPIIMKLESKLFKSIFTEEVEALAYLFKKYGFEIRIAGGAVRDLLMEIQPKDLDFATTATPVQMKDMFNTENIRMINMNGEKHGTITPRINDKENFEVTTLRVDLITDGRHAEVQFTTDWLLDALRRDLTINSMYLGLDGSLYDYFYGYNDLQKRRIAFVGNPISRIQEDYLRILRYFRFYGRISPEPNKHEEESLQAIKQNASGLAQISGERIWIELKKILEGNFAGDLMLTVIECGLSEYIGVPKEANCEELKRVWKQSGHHKLNAITLLSSLLNSTEDAIALNTRLKLSAFERDLAVFIVEHRDAKPNSKPLKPYQLLVVKSKSKPDVTKQYVIEVLKYKNSPLLEEFAKWEVPKFPVTGNMLKERGVESGRFMGVVMQELRNYWAENDFILSPIQILEYLPKVLELLDNRRKSKNKQ